MVACDRFSPHLFLSNNRCRDCDHPIEEHQSNDLTNNQTKRQSNSTLSYEDRIGVLVRASCTQFSPHAWIVDRCRDCNRSENEHESSLLSINQIQNESSMRPLPGKLTQVQHAPVRNEAEIAAVAKQSNNQSNATSTHPLQIKGAAQKVLDSAVSQMVLMNEEFDAIQSSMSESSNGSKEERDAKMAEFEALYQAKEAELRQQVEAAKQALEQERLMQSAVQSSNQSELEQARFELEQAKQQVLEAKREAELARAHAEHQASQSVSSGTPSAATPIREIGTPVEETRSPAEEAPQQASEEEPQQPAESVDTEKLQSLSTKVDEQEKLVEEEKVAETTEIMARASISEEIDEPVLLEKSEEESVHPVHRSDDQQPTALVNGPYAGTINLSDVLLKVEKLFLGGKNYVRVMNNSTKLVVISAFLRVIGDEYVLCWARKGSRSVHQSRCIPFSQLKAIVLGDAAFNAMAPNPFSQSHCLSIIGDNKCLHLIAVSDRDAEMTAFGLASLAKQANQSLDPSLPPVSVYDQTLGQNIDLSKFPSTKLPETENEDGSPIFFDGQTKESLIDALVDRPPVKMQMEVSIRCQHLPLHRGQALVCLVDQSGGRFVYSGQTEMAHSHNPIFAHRFTLEYEEHPDQPNNPAFNREIRFNVYDLSPSSTEINDTDRIGSSTFDLLELANNQSVNIVHLLKHKDPSKNAALAEKRSLMLVQCTKKQPMVQPVDQYTVIDKDSLMKLQLVLLEGAPFKLYSIDHSNNLLVQDVFIKYEVSPNKEYQTTLDAIANFVLGTLQLIVNGSAAETSSNRSMNLRSISDVYVGAKSPAFTMTSNLSPDQVKSMNDLGFSLVTRSGQRWDLLVNPSNPRTDGKAVRDAFVNGITGLLKQANQQAKQKAAKKLGLS